MQTLTKVRFGHSPDPDDAFMFYAIAHKTIDLSGFEVEHVVEDIESLNKRALTGELEVTAVSVHAYAYISDKYAIMRSGASMGEQYGPILVARAGGKANLKGKKIAVPGTMTSAFLTLKLIEKDFEHVVVPFDQILDFVRDGKADLGLIIHEGQITYGDFGLQKVMDLGEWWWQETKLPLPLGVDVIRKDLGPEKMKAFAKLFQGSIVYSLEHRKEALDYAMPYGRGITREAGDKFVGMYVNEITRDLGLQGEAGIRELLDRGFQAGILPKQVMPEFV
jgi:1,4-dihydroxy-6-naphthoate synthase